MAEPYLELLSAKLNSLNLASSEAVVLECKHFFSGAALYVNGKICATLTPAGFGLKLPQQTRDKCIGNGEGTELRYFANAPIKKNYIALAQAILDDPAKLRSLLAKSIHYVVE